MASLGVTFDISPHPERGAEVFTNYPLHAAVAANETIRRFLDLMPLGGHFSEMCPSQNLTDENSPGESLRSSGRYKQILSHPPPHNQRAHAFCFAAQARVNVDLAGQGDDLSRAA
ncbi:hypothetical protein NHU_03650 [Rhodovulum sulfidophilum]|uniref:Uncharacterized protein n=1 Tax=Rhodovulum sulfidophilum TaxID=35806 RepID=A0A0D6B6Q7_RHOSU|nr:hypothetical protein NHU_03650 [Rhodovulum sulfidophilum]